MCGSLSLSYSSSEEKDLNVFHTASVEPEGRNDRELEPNITVYGYSWQQRFILARSQTVQLKGLMKSRTI